MSRNILERIEALEKAQKRRTGHVITVIMQDGARQAMPISAAIMCLYSDQADTVQAFSGFGSGAGLMRDLMNELLT